MRYAAVCTDCVGDVGGRKSELIACDGVKSLRALIDGNESANLVEQACCALANVLHGDRETPGIHWSPHDRVGVMNVVP